jgi:hypothetical protein
MLMRNGHRLGLAAHHSDALVMLRRDPNRYPPGTVVVSVQTGQCLSHRRHAQEM